MSFKSFLYLFASMLSFFVIGLYAASEFKFDKPIELHRWVLSSLFVVAFIGLFLKESRKH
jgi:hypothetical protein